DKGDYLFCLADICNILNLGQSNKTANQIKEEFELQELNSASFDTGYGSKKFTMLTEPQLYFVMMRSRAKVAREFRQWICNEVLPSIRQTGTYSEPKKVVEVKNVWYTKEIAELFMQFKVTDKNLFKSVMDVTNRAFKQGYTLGYNKSTQDEQDKKPRPGVVLDEEQQIALTHICHYHQLFKPDLLKAYRKLGELKRQASQLVSVLNEIPEAKLYDAATAADFSFDSLMKRKPISRA
ncbi:MAG: Bro-N domain-containing protein, partial [Succinivibrio sp.]